MTYLVIFGKKNVCLRLKTDLNIHVCYWNNHILHKFYNLESPKKYIVIHICNYNIIDIWSYPNCIYMYLCTKPNTCSSTLPLIIIDYPYSRVCT